MAAAGPSEYTDPEGNEENLVPKGIHCSRAPCAPESRNTLCLCDLPPGPARCPGRTPSLTQVCSVPMQLPPRALPLCGLCSPSLGTSRKRVPAPVLSNCFRHSHEQAFGLGRCVTARRVLSCRQGPPSQAPPGESVQTPAAATHQQTQASPAVLPTSGTDLASSAPCVLLEAQPRRTVPAAVAVGEAAGLVGTPQRGHLQPASRPGTPHHRSSSLTWRGLRGGRVEGSSQEVTGAEPTRALLVGRAHPWGRPGRPLRQQCCPSLRPPGRGGHPSPATPGSPTRFAPHARPRRFRTRPPTGTATHPQEERPPRPHADPAWLTGCTDGKDVPEVWRSPFGWPPCLAPQGDRTCL